MGADERRWIRRWRWSWVGVAVGLAGCIQAEPFACQDDTNCVFEGQPGQCRASEQICIYPDDGCDTRWSTAQGECMSPVPASTGSSTGAESGSSVGSTGDSTTLEPGTTTVDLDPCDAGSGPSMDITGEGMVSASSVFSADFEPPLSVDGDYGTSWFSAGIELDGSPSLFEWSTSEPRCFTRISVIGNAEHEDPMLREGHGFASLVMRIYDADDAVVFQRMFILEGTPDPDAIAELSVAGTRVELDLIDHEAFNRGGFSELEIEGY